LSKSDENDFWGSVEVPSWETAPLGCPNLENIVAPHEWEVCDDGHSLGVMKKIKARPHAKAGTRSPKFPRQSSADACRQKKRDFDLAMVRGSERKGLVT